LEEKYAPAYKGELIKKIKYIDATKNISIRLIITPAIFH